MSGIKFSNTTPAAPFGQALVTFQADGQGHISAAYTAGGAGSSNSSEAVTQTAHGFSVGNAIYYTGSAWAKAKTDVVSTLGIGVVSAVTDANNFTVFFSGFVSGLSGFTAGQYYFVSDATAGLLTATEPTTVGHYSNPLFFAQTATSGIVLPFRPSQVEGGVPNLATATVDFGFAAGNEGDTVVVTVPATWVTVNSKIVCQVASVTTADHDPDDAAVEGIFALAQNLVAGVSFDILAVAPNNTWGRYTIFAWGF